VYLEPSDNDNLCLEVIAGGHTIPEIDREVIAIRRLVPLADVPLVGMDLQNDDQAEVVRLCDACCSPRRCIHADTGDTLIWHPQLPHGGTPINDLTRTRYRLVMHTAPVGIPG